MALRLVRIVAMALALCVASSADAEGLGGTVAGDRGTAIEVAAKPITHFLKSDPSRTAFGRLVWRGGLVLTSLARGFGGLSGLVMSDDGRRLLAVTDEGFWLVAVLDYEGAAPRALRETRLGPLRAPGGRALARKIERDAEGVTLLSGTLEDGSVLVAFERDHRLVRYPVRASGLGLPTGSIPLPPEARRMEANKGLEAVCRLAAGPRAGSILALAERLTFKGRAHTGWLLKDGNAERIALSIVDGFDITDCAGLPDGSILVLERRFRWSWGDPLRGPRMRLRRIGPAEQASLSTWLGEEVFAGGSEHEIDNMEALGTHTDTAGQTVVTFLSDDNFSAYLQRTVLLQFTLLPPDATAGR